MYFDVSNLDFSHAMDEVFLRLLLLGLRILQLLMAVPLIGLAATLVSDFNGAGIDIPSKAYATLVIACVCAAYTAVTFGPVFFEGELFFTTLTIFDVLLMGAFIGLTVEWNSDGTSTCSAYGDKYIGLYEFRHGRRTDCKVTKAMFAFLIADLALYVFSTATCFGLRSLELQHKCRWRDLPLIGRYRKGTAHKSSEHQCHCYEHCTGKASRSTSGSGVLETKDGLQTA